MTEAEVRGIVERYEGLIDLVVRSAPPMTFPPFSISFPAELSGKTLLVRENVEGDAWRMRSISIALE